MVLCRSQMYRISITVATLFSTLELVDCVILEDLHVENDDKPRQPNEKNGDVGFIVRLEYNEVYQDV